MLVRRIKWWRTALASAARILQLHITLHARQESKFKQYCTFYTTSAKKNRKSRQRKSCPTIPVGSNPPEVISQNQKPPYERQQQDARKQQQPLLNASVDASSVHYKMELDAGLRMPECEPGRVVVHKRSDPTGKFCVGHERTVR